MKALKISDHLSLPLDAVTQTIGILAVRGAGKSNTAAAMAEEMFDAGIHFAVIDPVGSWWGLRSSKDGKSPGLPIAIFGGKHGDIPLESGAGQLIADLIVEKRLSCVLDISEFDSESQKKKFLLDFALRLFKKNENPIHLFLEEADDFIPQKPMRDEAYLLRAWENIVRRGRARGIGLTLITQRSASLNKNVLTQVQTLIAMRTTGPQDRKAIEEWVKYHDEKREILESLSGLADGEAWIWSPQWLKLTKRVMFRQRETFDSGATPKELKGSRPPATLADVNLSAIQEQMKETIQKAKAEDPRELRKQIAELKKELQKKEARIKVKTETQIERVEVPILKDSQITRIEKLYERVIAEAERHGKAMAMFWKNQDEVATSLIGAIRVVANVKYEARQKPVILLPPAGNKITPKIQKPSDSNHSGHLPIGEEKTLAALIQYPNGLTRSQIRVFTDYRRSSSDAYIYRLQTKGYADSRGNQIFATQAGIDALPNYEPLPTGQALIDYWMNNLPDGERKILSILVQAYPESVPRNSLDEATGYARSSRDAYIYRLHTKELVKDHGKGEVRASENLFL